MADGTSATTTPIVTTGENAGDGTIGIETETAIATITTDTIGETKRTETGTTSVMVGTRTTATGSTTTSTSH